MLTLDRWVLEDTYRGVEKLIKKEAYKFCRKYGTDYDDALSECNHKFMQAYATFDAEKGSFQKWLVQKIRWHLLHLLRETIRKRLSRKECVLEEESCPGTSGRESHFLCDLCDGLSDDAAELVRCALDTPVDVVLTVAEFGKASGANVARAIKEHFGARGWSDDRVEDGFDEVRGKLLT